jgi:hypothetical protein
MLFLACFVFAIVGMNLFGTAERDGVWLNSHNNFEYFGTTLLLLFRCMTGENWNKIMYELYSQGYKFSHTYFVWYMVTAQYIMLNLFIAVILENFEEALISGADKVQQTDLENFVTQWVSVRDELSYPDRDQLPCYVLVKLLYSLPPPMGLKPGSSSNKRGAPYSLLSVVDKQIQDRLFITSLIQSLRLKVDEDGKIMFVNAITALVLRAQALKSGDVLRELSAYQRQEFVTRIRQISNKKFVFRVENMLPDKQNNIIDLSPHFNAATIVQVSWHHFFI